MTTSIGALSVQVTATTAKLQQQLNQIQARLGKFGKVGSTVNAQSAGWFSGLGGSALLAAGALGSVAVGMAAMEGFRVAAGLEQANVAFGQMLGSGSMAAAMLADIESLAARTPFAFDDLTQASQRMLAFGFSGQEVIPMLTKLGDLAAASPMGQSEAILRLTKAMGDMRGKGRVQAQEMNQLAEAGIPGWEALAQMLGKTVAETRELSEAGKITGQQGIDAIMKMASSSKFAGMMEKQSQTLGGLWSTMKDSATFALRDIAFELERTFQLKNLMKAATGGLDWLRGAMVGPLGAVGAFVRESLTPAFLDGFAVVRSAAAELWPVLAAGWGVFTAATDLAIASARVGFESLGGLFSSVFGTGAATTWRDTLIESLLSVEFALRNWGDYTEIAMTQASLDSTAFALDFAYLFSDTIPEALLWFAENMGNVLMDFSSFTSTVFSNLATNIGSVMFHLGDLLSGAVDWSDVWQPMTKGFESTIKTMPVFSQRAMSDTEKNMAQWIDEMSGNLGKKWNDFRDKRMGELFGGPGTNWAKMGQQLTQLWGRIEMGAGGFAAMFDLDKAAAAAAAKAAGGKVPEVKLAGAMEEGSKDALSTIAKFRVNREPSKVEEKQLQELKAAKDNLIKIGNGIGAIAAGLVGRKVAKF